MSNTINACIFDLDGVIVDTAKYHFLAWSRLAKELGINFTEHDNEKLKGVSRMVSLDILLALGNQNYSEADKLKMASRKNQWYREFILKMTPDEILPGVLTFLDELKQNNIKIALGSASKNARTILERVDLLSMFDAVIDGTEVSNAKPDPEVFLKGAQALETEPEACVVFEDAEAGVEAAIAGKMHCIGVGSNKILYKADWVINDFNEIHLTKMKTKLMKN